MTSRREVRVADSFFEELDLQLGSERGHNGEPSSTDFLVVDLPAIVEVFAVEFNALPETIGGLAAMRMFIGTSTLASAFVVYGSRPRRTSSSWSELSFRSDEGRCNA